MIKIDFEQFKKFKMNDINRSFINDNSKETEHKVWGDNRLNVMPQIMNDTKNKIVNLGKNFNTNKKLYQDKNKNSIPDSFEKKYNNFKMLNKKFRI